MAKCQGGNWWACVDHIHNNSRLENCTIYDDNTAYLTYKNNWELIPIFERTSWIKKIIMNLNQPGLYNGITAEIKTDVIEKLKRQLKYLEHDENQYFKKLEAIPGIIVKKG